jgi:hypothetical protein
VDYTDLTNALTILAVQAPSPYVFSTLPIDFQTMMPRFVEGGECLIYRDLVLLATRAQDASLTFTGATRSLNLSAASVIIIVPEGLSLIYPAGATPSAGTRIQFDAASLDTIDSIWQQESVTVNPTSNYADSMGRYWAMRDNQTMVVAPTPDSTYAAEITGLFQPAPISATNPTTYVSLTYPDLLLAACMITVAGYLRDYGQQADDPKLAQSWQQQYDMRKANAMTQEQRLRSQGAGWSPNLPTPLAQPPRT